VLHEIFLSDCYAVPTPLSDRVRVVVDLGANVGLTTLYYARRFPEARFVCVEPDPENMRLLRGNVASLGEQVLVLEAAVSDVAELAAFEATGWSWGRQLTPGRPTAAQVRCLTVPGVLAAAGVSRVDLLKVDIEGAVGRLFGSNNAWLTQVDTIIAELAPDYPVSRFEEDVRPFGLRVFAEGSGLGNVMTLATRRPLPGP
jgi:FkbM family methyltransferase